MQADRDGCDRDQKRSREQACRCRSTPPHRGPSLRDGVDRKPGQQREYDPCAVVVLRVLELPADRADDGLTHEGTDQYCRDVGPRGPLSMTNRAGDAVYREDEAAPDERISNPRGDDCRMQ